MAYEVTWTDQGVIEKYQGVLTFEDIENADGLLYGNRLFEEIKYLIIDLMEVTEHHIDDIDAKVIAYLDNIASTSKRELKMAIACRLPSLAAQVREYIDQSEALGSPWKVRCFADLESAKNWAAS